MTHDAAETLAHAADCGDTDPPAPRVLRPLRSPAHPRAQPVTTLVETIEGQIVPRLMLVRRAVGTVPRAPALTAGDVEELAQLLLHRDAADVLAHVYGVRARGVPTDAICLDLLAPAARRLGALWDDDETDFATVTVALCDLHDVLRHIAPGRPAATERGPAHSLLLAPAPGELHTFGLMMVGEFFRWHGWAVTVEYPASTSALLELVAGERYSLIGLTVGCREQLDGLSNRIAQVRRASRQRGIGVMLGGRTFMEHPELATRLGADATATDARDAAIQGDRIARLLV